MSDKQQRRDWGSAFSAFTNARVMGMMFLGFSAGLPYMLIFSVLSARLKDIGIPSFIIGFFAWISITYAIKIFWAPIVDVVNIPLLTKRLGHRRSWMLVSQIGIGIGLFGLSAINPHDYLWLLAWFGLLTAFCSATQDICIDAYRIEAVPNEFQAAMASTYMFGYRIAIVISGAGVLILSEFSSWSYAYFIMACLMSIGVITTFIIQEPENRLAQKTMPVELVNEYISSFKSTEQKILARILKVFAIVFVIVLSIIFLIFPVFIPIAMWILYKYRDRNVRKILGEWYQGTVVGPIVDFVFRFGFKMAMMVLALVMIYRISDLFMGFMANPLYIDMGFTKIEIALYTKIFGIIMTLIGTVMGGVMVMRYGAIRILLLGSIMVASTNLLFSALALWPSVPMLITVIIGDNISTGVATAAFIAYLSALVNKQYTATQYALFTSLMLLLGKFTQGFSGSIVEGIGYPIFFTIAAVTGIPTILLISYLIKIGHDPRPFEATDAESSEKAADKPAKKSGGAAVWLAYSVIPIVLIGLFVLMLFQRGIYQFNNPDQKLYVERGISMSPGKKVCWERLNQYRWDDEGVKKVDFIYFTVTKGVEIKKVEKKISMKDKSTDKSKKKIKLCRLKDGRQVQFSRGLSKNWSKAIKYHYRVGAIHTFSLCSKGLPQAQHMIKKVPRRKGSLPPTIKIQLHGNCPVHKQLKVDEVISEIKIMAKKIEGYYGIKPILMGSDKVYTLMVKDHLSGYHFWVDSVVKEPSSAEVGQWLLWQYTGRIPVDGISGNVKMSVLKGSLK